MQAQDSHDTYTGTAPMFASGADRTVIVMLKGSILLSLKTAGATPR